MSEQETAWFSGADSLRWGWSLDMAMAAAILVALILLALGNASMGSFKAKATEQVIAGAILRANVIEEYSIAGTWPSGARGGVPRDFADAPSKVKMETRYSAAGIVDSVIVTLGRYPGHLDETVIVTYRPVVPSAAEQPTVRWVCGNAATPPGWEGPAVLPATNLRDDFLLSTCRRRSG